MAFGLGLGRLGLTGGARWTPAKLWPLGAASPGMWIDPPYTASLYQDSAGTTPISAIGTVLDSSNPVGLVLDRKGGATSPADPGIHLSQSTSAARPVASARVNWLEQTALMGTAPWALNKVIPTQGLPAWDGALVATKFAVTAETATAPGEYQNSQSGAGARQIVDAKADGFNWISFIDASGSNPTVWFDVLNGVVGTQLPNYMGTIEPLPNGWFRCTMIPAAGISQPYYQWFVTDSDGTVHVNGDGVKGVLLAYPQDTFPNNEFQTVVSNSNYDAEGFPVATKFDGVDDSLASVTFTAGTLIDGMDCLIAVRRDSAAAVVAGLYNAVADATKFFGMAESGSGSGCVGSGAGTPTVLVDGTQLTGGTAVTRGTLHTALTPGDWHILEFRNLDLSTWTAVGFGLYTGYVLNGGYGGHKVFSNGQDANRDLARAQMAAYFGVTLP